MKAREHKNRDDLVHQAKLVITELRVTHRELGAVLKPWAVQEGRLMRLRDRLPAAMDQDLPTLDEPTLRAVLDDWMAERIGYLESLIEDWKGWRPSP